MRDPISIQKLLVSALLLLLVLQASLLDSNVTEFDCFVPFQL
jgi:hypothetical protein